MADLREIARRSVPRSVFDYVDGAAEQEVSIARSRAAFRDIEFSPRVLRDVSTADTTANILGSPSSLPLILAPTGFTRLMHHVGEPAVARAAGRAGIPYVLSTMGTTSIEELQHAAPTADLWFQLYLWRDRGAGADLIDDAAARGIRTLVLTVDTPIGGARMRDVRNGFTIPPTLTMKTFMDITKHPKWWANLLSTRPLEFAAMRSSGGTVEELIGTMFDPSVTLDDLEWLRAKWSGKLVVKGIQSVPDAIAVTDCGADAVVVSNHGGRQLDRAVTPLHTLPRVVDAIGSRAEVLVDTGVMSGTDLVVAQALGASAAMVGRAYLYGLMAGGERGVSRTIEIMGTEAQRTMRLLGANQLRDITSDHVKLLHAGRQ